jgi:hypothetical protein
MDKTDELLLQSAILLKRQGLLTENLIRNGEITLKNFETAISKSGQQNLEHVLNVINYVFGLIDNLVRYQKIAGSIPKLNHKSPEYRSFTSGMGNLKEVRNIHQHVNNDIMENFTGPLLGSVSWSSGQKCLTACLHDIGRERSLPALIYDTQEKKFTSTFCYIFGQTYYDLEKAITSMKQFDEFIDKSIRIEANGSPFLVEDHFIAMSAEFVNFNQNI